eukprot:1839592-Amphidinium_carterae.2
MGSQNVAQWGCIQRLHDATVIQAQSLEVRIVDVDSINWFYLAQDLVQSRNSGARLNLSTALGRWMDRASPQHGLHLFDDIGQRFARVCASQYTITTSNVKELPRLLISKPQTNLIKHEGTIKEP